MNASSFSGWSGSWDSVPAALVSSAMDLNLSRIQPVRVGRRMHAMCGILTFISSRGDAAGYRQAVSDALESLHHRGPDDTGVEVFGRDVIFAHKRLFHPVTPDGLFLASEKKPLLPFAPSAQAGDAGVETAGLSHYLTLQYVPEPGTLHQGIGRVGSGECFTYRAGGVFATRRYYQPRFRPAPTANPEDLYRKIQDTLRESGRI